MKKLVIFFVASTLVTFKAEANHTQNIQLNVKPPFFKMVLLSDYYSDYLKGVRQDSTNYSKIYIKKIQDPIIEAYFTKSEYLDIVKESFFAVTDTIQLAKAITAIEYNKKEIESIISTALSKCNQYLKNDTLTFYILPSQNGMKQILKMMGGASGLTAGSKQILLTIDPEINSWKEVLAYTVAHEFNHAYWTNTKFTSSYKWTVLRYLVFEGRADYFAHSIYPNVKAPWTAALKEKEKKELWNKVKPLLGSEDVYLMTEIMFGSQKYPMWGGYTLGYDIVQSAFKTQPKTAPTIKAEMEAETILEISIYK